MYNCDDHRRFGRVRRGVLYLCDLQGVLALT